MLDPAGSHKQGDFFLSRFMRALGIDNFSTFNAVVRREHRNIDIYITNSHRQAVIVENKIYAADQDHQLKRYYSIATEEGYSDIILVYLTLNGKAPTKTSIGNLPAAVVDGIIHAAYSDQILSWIDISCQDTDHAVLRETLAQYKQLLFQLFGRHPSKEYIMELTALLMQDNNLQIASDISEALTEARINIQFKFWTELEATLKAHSYTLLEKNRYNRKTIGKYYALSAPPVFGISCKLEPQPFADDEISFAIELWQSSIYLTFRETTNKQGRNKKYDQLAHMLADKIGYKSRTDYEIAWKWREAKPKANFRTLAELINDAHRKTIVESILAEVNCAMKEYPKVVKTLQA